MHWPFCCEFAFPWMVSSWLQPSPSSLKTMKMVLNIPMWCEWSVKTHDMKENRTALRHIVSRVHTENCRSRSLCHQQLTQQEKLCFSVATGESLFSSLFILTKFCKIRFNHWKFSMWQCSISWDKLENHISWVRSNLIGPPFENEHVNTSTMSFQTVISQPGTSKQLDANCANACHMLIYDIATIFMPTDHLLKSKHEQWVDPFFCRTGPMLVSIAQLTSSEKDLYKTQLIKCWYHISLLPFDYNTALAFRWSLTHSNPFVSASFIQHTPAGQRHCCLCWSCSSLQNCAHA